MGLKKTIYIPEGMWQSVQENAKRENRSISSYLINLHREHLGCLGNDKWEEREPTDAPSKSVQRRHAVHKDAKLIKETVAQKTFEAIEEMVGEISQDWRVAKQSDGKGYYPPMPKKGKKK